MFHLNFKKLQYLRARDLKEMYSGEGEKDRTAKYVYEHFGYQFGIGDDTFYTHCKRGDALDEELPLTQLAELRAMQRNNEMEKKLADGVIHISQVPYPEYKDLVDAYHWRLKQRVRKKLKQAEKEELAKKKELAEQH